MKFHPQTQDNKLVEGCINGNRSAQKALYAKYYSQMLKISMRYANDRDEAVQILNDAFLKVFKGIKNYRGEGALGAWIGKLTFYTAIDFIRKNTSYRTAIILDNEEDLMIDSKIIDSMSANEIMQTIQELSAASRSVFSLYIIEGYSHKEIAETLGISVGTSKWHLSNAKKELIELLEGKGIAVSY